MNEIVKRCAQEVGFKVDWQHDDIRAIKMARYEKFAELIVKECMKEALEEIISDEDIEAETDPFIREYLIGNNLGIVDAVVRFRNHFGVTE